MDLLTNYDNILPPTLARKKRDSERKLPTRKRTAPVDMRMSRSRITDTADTQQLLAAQKLAQNPSLARKSPDILSPPPRQSMVLPPVAEPTPPPPPPLAAIAKPVIPPVPQPPPNVEPVAPVVALPPPPQPVIPVVPPPPPVVTPQPNRPSFKEPPPELDYASPRPMFKEPPPDVADATIPRETPSVPPPVMGSPPPTPSVVPPTPQKSNTGSSSPSPTKFGSRSPTPPDDGVLSSGKASLSRNTSGQSAVVRGPRITRGPRASGGNVSSLVSSLNRNSNSGAPAGTSPPKSSPIRNVNRLSGSQSPVRRPSSVLGRSSAFSRRTMASDAEDEIVDRG